MYPRVGKVPASSSGVGGAAKSVRIQTPMRPAVPPRPPTRTPAVTPAGGRLKAHAPPPPPLPSRSKSADARATPSSRRVGAGGGAGGVDDGLSLRAMFDELGRNSVVLSENVEIKFREFQKNVELMRQRWLHSEMESQRLRIELAASVSDSKSKDYKLQQARALCEAERQEKEKAARERDIMNHKLQVISDLLLNGGGGSGNTLNNETRDRIKQLRDQGSTTTLGAGGGFAPSAPHMNAIDEMDSTGSILDASDLSYDETRTRELLESRHLREASAVAAAEQSKLRNGKPYKRRSGGSSGGGGGKKTRRQSRSFGRETSAVDADPGDRIIATTKITVGRDGSARAETSLEKEPAAAAKNKEKVYDAVVSDHRRKSHERRVTYKRLAEEKEFEPSAPVRPRLDTISSPVVRTFSNAGTCGGLPNRPHRWQKKKAKFSERCAPCNNERIKFSKDVMKCGDCMAECHPACRDRVALPCVPVSNRTPVGKNGTVADYTPLEPPMIPALVIHCIREIERRGLATEGLYRVPGSQSEVQDLLDKFVRGKFVPNLAAVRDVHAVTGCLKKFLLALKEPLVPNSLSHLFLDAATNPDTTDAESAMIQAVAELPQPNRDTLAYVMLHLQRVADSPETKMPASSLSNVFGPNLVGYASHADVNPMSLIAVVRVMLGLAADYWAKFIQTGDEENLFGKRGNTMRGHEQQMLRQELASTAGSTPLTSDGANRRSRVARQIAPAAQDQPKTKKTYFQSPMLF